MRWFKRPFSEQHGISPGGFTSPGLCRLRPLLKAMVLFFSIALIIYLGVTYSLYAHAATVSDNDAALPAESPSPSYTIENEVNLDGANLFSSSDSVTVYMDEFVLPFA